MTSIARRTIFRVVVSCKFSPNSSNRVRTFSSFIDSEKKDDSKFYATCFRTLELDPDSSQDLVRRQYIRLVKKFHPDSANTDSEKEVFQKEFLRIDQVR